MRRPNFIVSRQLSQPSENAQDPNREKRGHSSGLKVGCGVLSVAEEPSFLVLVGIAGFV